MIDIPFPKLKDSQKAILYGLAVSGPCYGYELYKKYFRRSDASYAGLTNKTVYTELHALEKLGLVESKESQNKKKTGRKRGRPAKTRYSLSLLGLCCTLATTNPNSYMPIDKVLRNWGSLIPTIDKMWQILERKSFSFEKNLCKSFADLLATIFMSESFFYSYVSEDAILFDLIYHCYDEDLRPPFIASPTFADFRHIYLKFPEFKEKVEQFAKILWLDSKWRTLLYEERKTLVEQPLENWLHDFTPWGEEQERLNAKVIYKEREAALAEWPLSVSQFLRLKALHEIWLIKEGEFGLEYSTYV